MQSSHSNSSTSTSQQETPGILGAGLIFIPTQQLCSDNDDPAQEPSYGPQELEFFLNQSMLLRFPFSLLVLKYSNFQNILTGSHALLEGGALWGWWWWQVFTSGKSANPTVHC